MTEERFKAEVEKVFPKVENIKSKQEDTPDIEVNWRVASTVKNLILAFEAGNPEQQTIAQKIQEAEDYWQENKDEIVEGVLNTADDVSKPGYVDGSNREVRKKLGEIVKELKNKQLEARVRELMKEEMKEYFQANQISLAEIAIKNAPSLPSLFEVVKRFRQIDDQVKVYKREELMIQFIDILATDKKFTQLLDQYQTEKKIPDFEKVKELYEQTMFTCSDLPEAYGISAIVKEKLTEKFNKLEAISEKNVQQEVKKTGGARENQVKTKSSWTSRLVSGVKSWFNR
jgi:hypothetical protein